MIIGSGYLYLFWPRLDLGYKLDGNNKAVYLDSKVGWILLTIPRK